jgi:hypothetical protein
MTRRSASRPPIHSDQEIDTTKTTPDQNKVLVLEATKAESVGGLPMFGDRFPA